MGRERDPRRDRAFELWVKYNCEIQIADIAHELGLSPGTVRGWKSKDKWHEKVNGTLFSQKDLNAPGAPLKNKNAVKTGEHMNFFDDVLEPEELEMFEEIDFSDTITQLTESIKLYTMRERIILKRIADIKQGIGVLDRTIVQKRMKVKEPTQIRNNETGAIRSIVRENYRLVTDMVTEKEKAQIEHLLKLEDALTKVQKEKTKALIELNKIQNS